MGDVLMPVLIAGIGGASLGTEILKCLESAGRYRIFGCDISEYAFGHYQKGFTRTFLLDRKSYVESVRDLCREYRIRAVIPGGEEPLALLGREAHSFQSAGVHIIANSPEVGSTCSDKAKLFQRLEDLHIPTPRTISINDARKVEDIPYPCVVKPSTGTGGSSFVFLASNSSEAQLYVSYLLNNFDVALVQEYIPLDEGEFTIGVLSLPNGRVIGSVALRRLFQAKLSVSAKTRVGLISSGYSQGLIDDFPDVCAQAERIATALGSIGPANIQGRLRDGVLIPFEINPRFSASTYLRTMAGFNEIDLYLRCVLEESEPAAPRIRPGYYLRSLTEVFVPAKEIMQ